MERLIVWHRWCPPLDVTPEAVSKATAFRMSAREAFAQLGADPLSELSGTVVFSLAPGDLPRAVELCFGLAVRAQGEDAASVGNVSFALTLGQLDRVGVSGAWVGDVLDRAQMLASVAGAGDVVLDMAAQSRLVSTHLFAREIQTPTGTPGFVLDSGHPYRERCRDSLAFLARPVLPASCAVQLDALRKLAFAPGRQRVLLVGARGSGAGEWISQLARELKPPAWIDVRALGTGFAPLSGLMYALRRLPQAAALERVLDAPEEADQQARRVLMAIRAGHGVSRREAIMGLRQYAGRCWERSGQKAFITVNPTALIDPASIGVIAEVARDGGPECFVVMRLWPDTKAPEGFLRAGGLSEVRVPSLSAQDAQRLAASMLGQAPAEIARRAAVMGGASPLGVAEAVRVLLSSGDVVHRGGGFVWRRGPAGRNAMLGADALLDERIAPLPVTTQRVLEILCCVPDPSDQAVLNDVALVEGVTSALRKNALDELVRLALIDVDGSELSVPSSVRDAVERSMSDARRSELYLRIATALTQHDGGRGSFARADVAYYLARGGRAKDAVPTLLEVAREAGAFGYVRSGVRLAAAAVECDPSEDTQREAARIAQTLSDGPGARGSRVSLAPVLLEPAAEVLASTLGLPEPAPPAPARQVEPPRPPRAILESATDTALSALMRGDREAFDRALELMVAAGHDGAHVDRLRALYALSRGQLHDAADQLARARTRQPGRAALPSARMALSEALLELGRGDVLTGVRGALDALALSLGQGDGQGRAAALHALAFCYRQLGRGAEAQHLSQAARAQVAAPLASDEAQR